MKLAIDVSYYNNLSPEQYKLLSTVIKGVIIRLGFGMSLDSEAEDHIARCKAIGLPWTGYIWADPTRSVDQQLIMIRKAIWKYEPPSLFLDAEQWWRDWNAYMRGDYSTAYLTRFSPVELEKYYLKLYEETKKITTIPVGNYSADWFIDRYAPKLANWIFHDRYWEARYFRYYDKSWWTARQKELGRNFPIENMLEIAQNAIIHRGIARQIESYIEVKGLAENIGYHLDWNVFTEDGFNVMFNMLPDISKPLITQPELQETYRVTETLNIREKPSITARVIGWKLPGQMVWIMKKDAGWYQLSTGGWVYSKYLIRATE